MTDVKVVKVEGGPHALALISERDDSVWVTVSLKWWDLATLVWWFLCPADKKGFANITRNGKGPYRTRVIRIADRYARIGKTPITKKEMQE